MKLLTKLSTTYIIFIILMIAGCSSSDEKQKLIQECTNQHYAQGIIDKKTGLRVTPQNDTSYYTLVLHACISKVDLYSDGYRVRPYIEGDDVALEINGIIKRFYKKKLKCESSADQCK